MGVAVTVRYERVERGSATSAGLDEGPVLHEEGDVEEAQGARRQGTQLAADLIEGPVDLMFVHAEIVGDLWNEAPPR